MRLLTLASPRLPAGWLLPSLPLLAAARPALIMLYTEPIICPCEHLQHKQPLRGTQLDSRL